MEYDQMRFIFQSRLSCDSHIFQLVLQYLDPIGKKAINSRYDAFIQTFSSYELL